MTNACHEQCTCMYFSLQRMATPSCQVPQFKKWPSHNLTVSIYKPKTLWLDDWLDFEVSLSVALYFGRNTETHTGIFLTQAFEKWDKWNFITNLEASVYILIFSFVVVIWHEVWKKNIYLRVEIFNIILMLGETFQNKIKQYI